MIIYVDAVTPDPSARAGQYPSSIAIGHGTNEAGDTVTFAGQSNELWSINAALEAGSDPIPVEVEAWQLKVGW